MARMIFFIWLTATGPLFACMDLPVNIILTKPGEKAFGNDLKMQSTVQSFSLTTADGVQYHFRYKYKVVPGDSPGSLRKNTSLCVNSSKINDNVEWCTSIPPEPEYSAKPWVLERSPDGMTIAIRDNSGAVVAGVRTGTVPQIATILENKNPESNSDQFEWGNRRVEVSFWSYLDQVIKKDEYKEMLNLPYSNNNRDSQIALTDNYRLRHESLVSLKEDGLKSGGFTEAKPETVTRGEVKIHKAEIVGEIARSREQPPKPQDARLHDGNWETQKDTTGCDTKIGRPQSEINKSKAHVESRKSNSSGSGSNSPFGQFIERERKRNEGEVHSGGVSKK